MELNEAAIRKLVKEEIVKLALEYKSKFDSTLSSMNDIKTSVWTEDVLLKTRAWCYSNKTSEH